MGNPLLGRAFLSIYPAIIKVLNNELFQDKGLFPGLLSGKNSHSLININFLFLLILNQITNL